jgi:hypothetical protein
MSEHPWDQWLIDAKRQQQERNKAERAARPKGQKCSTCEHHRGHPFSPKYHYCTKGTSKHTSNGWATTKPGSWCSQWQSKTSP